MQISLLKKITLIIIKLFEIIYGNTFKAQIESNLCAGKIDLLESQVATAKQRLKSVALFVFTLYNKFHFAHYSVE